MRNGTKNFDARAPPTSYTVSPTLAAMYEPLRRLLCALDSLLSFEQDRRRSTQTLNLLLLSHPAPRPSNLVVRVDEVYVPHDFIGQTHWLADLFDQRTFSASRRDASGTGGRA